MGGIKNSKYLANMRRKDELALALNQDRVDRFWARISKTDTCWLHDAPDCRGYSIVYLAPQTLIPAHRFALLRRRGKLPKDGMLACHKCRNKHCVRPDHLYWGTPKQNNSDMTKDGTRNPIKGTEHFKAKIDQKIAIAMVKSYAKGKLSIAAIGKKFGVSHTCVTYVLTGRTWRDATEGSRVPIRAIEARAIKKGSAHYMAKMSAKSIKSIRERWAAGESSITMANEYDVAPRTIRDIGNRITWKHIP